MHDFRLINITHKIAKFEFVIKIGIRLFFIGIRIIYESVIDIIIETAPNTYTSWIVMTIFFFRSDLSNIQCIDIRLVIAQWSSTCDIMGMEH